MDYLVYFESANYAGYGEHVIVDAADEDHARELVEDYAQEFYYDQDGDQLEEDEVDTYGCYATIMSVELFNESHPAWEHRDTFIRLD